MKWLKNLAKKQTFLVFLALVIIMIPIALYQSSAFESDMLHTVNCFLDNNLNIAETARQLHIHRNTLLYRLDQIDKETGLDIRQFNQAMIYKIASLILLKLSKTEND